MSLQTEHTYSTKSNYFDTYIYNYANVVKLLKIYWTNQHNKKLIKDMKSNLATSKLIKFLFFVNLVELAKTIAAGTYYLKLIFSCRICPQSRS